VLAPAGTPIAVLRRLNVAIATAMSEPDVRARLAQTGVVPGTDSVEDFESYLKLEYARWGQLIREKGIKAE
jgi:tripartite-type tricarboxylate transporter receptor subunit TctC